MLHTLGEGDKREVGGLRYIHSGKGVNGKVGGLRYNSHTLGEGGKREGGRATLQLTYTRGRG